MSLRANTRAKVRELATRNEGTLDNGSPWSNWTIEVLDEDDNKVKLRVPSQEFAQGLTVGEWFDFVLDCASTGRAKFTVKSYSPASAKSSRAAA